MTAVRTLVMQEGRLREAVIASRVPMLGAYAARPAASSVPAGTTYVCDDVREEYWSDGTEWSLSSGAGELLAAAERTDPYVVTAGSPGVDVPGLTLTLISGERPLVISFGASLRVTGAAGDVGAVILNVDGVNRSQLLVPGLANFTGFSRDVLISDKPPGTVITAKITAFVTGGASLTVFGHPADKSFLYARNA